MVDYEKMSASEVQGLARQGDKDALYEMAWRIELLPVGDRDKPVECCAWQDYWCEKAADAGNVEAKARYARSLLDRVMNAEDRQKALCYFQSLADDFDAGKLNADQMESGALSKFWLGIMLCQGYHTRRDPILGTTHIKTAEIFFNGFDGFGYKLMSVLGEVYAQGLAQPGEEPSIDDLEKAIKYLSIAIERFKPERDDPNNRGYLQKKIQYLDIVKKHKESKEVIKRRTGRDNTNLPDGEATERRRKLLEIPPAAQQRMEADKAAFARLRRRLEQEGWNDEFYVLFGSERQGPYGLKQLEQLHQGGQFKRDTLVWKEGMEQWGRAGDRLELSAIFGVSKKQDSEVKIPPVIPIQAEDEKMPKTTAKQADMEKTPKATAKPTKGKKKHKSTGKGRNRVPAIIAGAVITLLLAAGAAYYFLFYLTGEANDYSLIPVSNDGER